MSGRFIRGKRALIIVAHPDDETIWMGGFILKHPGLQWTIFSLCRASDKDRAPKFHRVCQLYKAEAIMEDLEDEGKLSVKQTVPVIKKLVEKNISQCKFDYIFTHGANGEYGHPRHIGVHRAVKELIKKKILKPEMVCYFNYKKISSQAFSLLIALKDSDLLVKLTKKEFIKKRNIVAKTYGYDPMGIDVGYCTNPEAFKIKIVRI
jgi:LmbE family N-acetylglucosaminyl deacetylase